MINEHKKINPEIKVLEKYVGIKNEISQKKKIEIIYFILIHQKNIKMFGL